MTEQTAREKVGEPTREQVADYLRAHPDFFVEQDELLRSLTLPHDSGRAISLVERQVHLFREQRDTLRRELVELVSIARHNDRLFEKSKRLLMQVIEARSLNDMAAAIDDSVRGDFGLDAASILLFSETELPDAAQGALHVVNPKEAHERLGNFLEGERAVCGQFRESDREFLFPDREEPIASVALVPLRNEELVGVFAIGSCEPGYFDQSMGSLFLSYISDTLSRLLPPMIGRHTSAAPVTDIASESR
ncbi:MAG: DUF484 family protein [Gammaproteobacteria bacterium]|uniref:DUF484 domain-containing protein n=1 Tax=Marinobacter nitratireducens TaxID=1137280 RepID=A0A072NB00_9GAMM|nr:DUF484 family protein [Marinobacter nitratireducens]KEF30240.1 Hypothetical protein D777_03416 [Marinobacter nitratireducens]TNE71398.1 MAG: DUF484 family protein [Gammaproteobacteria bacterium]TNE94321.1 MAG: DUF484 family protein [Gammaproteobacteria bacterium]